MSPVGLSAMKTTKQRVDGDVAVVDREDRRPAGFDGADDEAAEESAGQGANSADHRRRQRLERQGRRERVADRAEGGGHDGAGEARQSPGEGEGARNRRSRADAEHLGLQRVLRIGAPFPPGAGPAEDDDEGERDPERDAARDKGHRRGDGDEFGRAGQRERLVQDRRHPARPVALGDAQQFLQEDGEPGRSPPAFAGPRARLSGMNTERALAYPQPSATAPAMPKAAASSGAGAGPPAPAPSSRRRSRPPPPARRRRS